MTHLLSRLAKFDATMGIGTLVQIIKFDDL